MAYQPITVIDVAEDIKWKFKESLPDKQTVVDVCKAEYIKHNGHTNCTLWPIDQPLYFIKFGSVEMGEARNQRYFFEMTRESKIIRVPEVFWAFVGNHGFTYIIAEYVEHDGFASM